VRIRPYGADALLVELADERPGAAHDLARWARAVELDVAEVVPGASTVLLAGVTDRWATEQRLAGWSPEEASVTGVVVEIPVRYDGPDLADVARRWGMTEQEVVATHSALEHVVAFCGFAPGFPYVAGLPDELAVPRLESPRPRVPAGSVGVADVWTGIYPTGSPGGWRLIGTTDVVLWDPGRDHPALLPPGTRLRIVVVS
jgi:KipI family sensor histidine kinase inhibitor